MRTPLTSELSIFALSNITITITLKKSGFYVIYFLDTDRAST